MKKVLIIEDDPVVAHVYRSRLEKEGFEVDVAPDGQAGFYRIYEMHPDALLLDLMLPKINGIALLKKLRAVREFEKLPVIVFTNAYVANMIHEAFSAGASGVYNKSSVTPRQIIDVINTLLSPTAGGKAAAPAAAATPEAKPALINTQEDSAFQTELMKSFLASAPGAVSEMRKLLQETSKAQEAARAPHVEALYRKVRSFATNASMAGLPSLAKMGAASEALVKEMMEKPKSVTASTLRTTAHAIDFFAELSKPGLPGDLADNPPIDILIVDDEMLSRRAIVYALEKAFLKATPVEDGEAALAKANSTKFDLIFLDVNMPGMDGFQLCDKLRNETTNKTTPVIFVTGSADFQVRAQSTLRGASDVIAKPFMFIELTVKALTFALRHRIEAQKQYVATKGATTSATTPPGARTTPAPAAERTEAIV
jgi:DNA-binding response OmpR family regulator